MGIMIDVDRLKEILNENKVELTNNIISIVREHYISKADYENRLKAEKVAMLEDLKLDIEAKMSYYKQASKEPANYVYEVDMYGRMLGYDGAKQIIQQKIDKLKEAD